MRLQTRNKNRVNVFIDDQFAFGLTKIEAARLRLGQVLTEDDVARLKHADAFETAYEKALRFLSSRPRSEAEVRQNLKKPRPPKRNKGERLPAEKPPPLPDDIVDAVIARLRRADLINDEAFAQYWVENRGAFRPKGKRALVAELRAKGLSQHTVAAAVADTDDMAVAHQLAQERAPRLKGLPKQDFRRKLSEYLARRGVGFDAISDAVERAWREHGGDHQEFEDMEGED